MHSSNYKLCTTVLLYIYKRYSKDSCSAGMQFFIIHSALQELFSEGDACLSPRTSRDVKCNHREEQKNP